MAFGLYLVSQPVVNIKVIMLKFGMIKECGVERAPVKYHSDRAKTTVDTRVSKVDGASV